MAIAQYNADVLRTVLYCTCNGFAFSSSVHWVDFVLLQPIVRRIASWATAQLMREMADWTLEPGGSGAMWTSAALLVLPLFCSLSYLFAEDRTKLYCTARILHLAFACSSLLLFPSSILILRRPLLCF
jgi:hypothetical protein